MRVANLGLADSALHAPAAGSGDTDFFPDFVDKAAVLTVARPESSVAGWQQARGLGRAACVDLNGWVWNPRPDIDQAEHAVLAIAAGDWDEEAIADWLRRHLVPPGES